MSHPVIQTEDLTVYYGRHVGIADVNLSVQEGEIFGFLGPNGAGKTTTLRVLLDVIRPSKGRARLFGRDCQQEGANLRERVGYLPGELNLPSDLRGGSFLNLVRSIRGSDPSYQEALVRRLKLDPDRFIREYSRGNKQKVGLIAAFMHKPDVLILDEPTSGLDPLMQQTVLKLVKEARSEGRTVLFSSHVLSEVQAVCDRVGMIRGGRLIATERVETLMEQQFHRLHLTFAEPPPSSAFSFKGVTLVAREGADVTLEVHANLPAVLKQAAEYDVTDIETQPVNLEDVFLSYYGAPSAQEHD